MFERFTRTARAAVTAAQQEATRAGSPTIDTRHLLLAVLPDPVWRGAGVDTAALEAALRAAIGSSGLDRDALAAVGVDLDAVSAQADAVFGADALSRAGRRRGSPRFARDAKKALELALREAVRLGHRSIDTRHLLLGVLRADCPGRAVLVGADVDLAALRGALEGPAAASA